MSITTPELILTRVFPVTRESVFAAWTEEKQAARWWSPRGFSTEVCELEARQGGILYIEMRSPEGTIYPMTGSYREVTFPESLIFTCAPLEKGEELFEVLHHLTLKEENGGTTMTLKATVTKTTPSAPQYLEGMAEGWNQTLDKLGAYLASAKRS